MAKMVGRKTIQQGCCHGKYCTCNNYYRDAKMVRVMKRRERREWKREASDYQD